MIKPVTAMLLPRMIDRQLGCASQTYNAAKTNPSGTRMRRAIFCQLGMVALQQLAGGGQNFIRRDLKQSRVWLAGVRKRSAAGRITQNNGFLAVRAIARGIGRSEDRDYRNAQCRGEMQRTSVTADEKTCAAGTGNEFGY